MKTTEIKVAGYENYVTPTKLRVKNITAEVDEHITAVVSITTGLIKGYAVTLLLDGEKAASIYGDENSTVYEARKMISRHVDKGFYASQLSRNGNIRSDYSTAKVKEYKSAGKAYIAALAENGLTYEGIIEISNAMIEKMIELEIEYYGNDTRACEFKAEIEMAEELHRQIVTGDEITKELFAEGTYNETSLENLKEKFAEGTDNDACITFAYNEMARNYIGAKTASKIISRANLQFGEYIFKDAVDLHYFTVSRPAMIKICKTYGIEYKGIKSADEYDAIAGKCTTEDDGTNEETDAENALEFVANLDTSIDEDDNDDNGDDELIDPPAEETVIDEVEENFDLDCAIEDELYKAVDDINGRVHKSMEVSAYCKENGIEDIVIYGKVVAQPDKNGVTRYYKYSWDNGGNDNPYKTSLTPISENDARAIAAEWTAQNGAMSFEEFMTASNAEYEKIRRLYFAHGGTPINAYDEELAKEYEPEPPVISYDAEVWTSKGDNGAEKYTFKTFSTATAAYKWLLKKRRRYADTTSFGHVIEKYEDGISAGEIYSYETGWEVETTDADIQALIDEENFNTDARIFLKDCANYAKVKREEVSAANAEKIVAEVKGLWDKVQAAEQTESAEDISAKIDELADEICENDAEIDELKKERGDIEWRYREIYFNYGKPYFDESLMGDYTEYNEALEELDSWAWEIKVRIERLENRNKELQADKDKLEGEYWEKLAIAPEVKVPEPVFALQAFGGDEVTALSDEVIDLQNKLNTALDKCRKLAEDKLKTVIDGANDEVLIQVKFFGENFSSKLRRNDKAEIEILGNGEIFALDATSFYASYGSFKAFMAAVDGLADAIKRGDDLYTFPEK